MHGRTYKRSKDERKPSHPILKGGDLIGLDPISVFHSKRILPRYTIHMAFYFILFQN